MNRLVASHTLLWTISHSCSGWGIEEMIFACCTITGSRISSTCHSAFKKLSIKNSINSSSQTYSRAYHYSTISVSVDLMNIFQNCLLPQPCFSGIRIQPIAWLACEKPTDFAKFHVLFPNQNVQRDSLWRKSDILSFLLKQNSRNLFPMMLTCMLWVSWTSLIICEITASHLNNLTIMNTLCYSWYPWMSFRHHHPCHDSVLTIAVITF